MSEDIIPYGSDSQSAIEKFQMLLNQYPDKRDLTTKTKAKAKKKKPVSELEYIPIRKTERILDEIYSGLWKTENFRWQVIANEIVGTIDLHVFHPIAKVWLVRSGSAGKMILTHAGKPPTIDHKIINTLEKDFPNLETMCLRKAAKSLGVVFGRGLNDDDEENFTYLSEQVEGYTHLQQDATQLLERAILTEKEREAIGLKVAKHRYTHKVLEQVINYLNTKQP